MNIIRCVKRLIEKYNLIWLVSQKLSSISYFTECSLLGKLVLIVSKYIKYVITLNFVIFVEFACLCNFIKKLSIWYSFIFRLVWISEKFGSSTALISTLAWCLLFLVRFFRVYRLYLILFWFLSLGIWIL